jgi:hypothetical protein
MGSATAVSACTSGRSPGGPIRVQGAATAQRALAAGLLDEIEIHLIPLVTHVRYRVRR